MEHNCEACPEDCSWCTGSWFTCGCLDHDEYRNETVPYLAEDDKYDATFLKYGEIFE